MKSVSNDVRADAIGGMSVAFIIWEMAVTTMLLHNGGTWVSMKKRTVKELEKMQLKHLGVGEGCPKALLYALTGTMAMVIGVLLLKLQFIYYVATLPRGSLLGDLYQAQYDEGYPGLVSELRPIQLT